MEGRTSSPAPREDSQQCDRLPERPGAQEDGLSTIPPLFRSDASAYELDLEAGNVGRQPHLQEAPAPSEAPANRTGAELPTASGAAGGEGAPLQSQAPTDARSPARSTVTMQFFLGDPDASPRGTLSGTGGLTPWRLPTTVGKLPVYVQSQFRLKTMTIVCLQFLLAVLVMTGLTALQAAQYIPTKMQMVLVMLCAGIQGFSLMALGPRKVLRRRHCVLLALLAISSAVMWDVFNAIMGSHLMDIHVGFILLVAMVVATGYAALHARQGRREPRSMVVSSFLTGWVIATLLQFAVMTALDRDCYLVMEAGGLCLMIFLLAAMEVAQGLAESNPDDYVSIITRLNSNLLVIWSIPLFGFFDLCVAARRDGIPDLEGEHPASPPGAGTLARPGPQLAPMPTLAPGPALSPGPAPAATREVDTSSNTLGLRASSAEARVAGPAAVPSPTPSARMVLHA